MSDAPCRRFILRYSGEGNAPLQVLDHLERLPGAKIVDRTTRMLLVEGDPHALAAIVAQCPEWLMSAEVQVPAPDPRPKPDD